MRRGSLQPYLQLAPTFIIFALVFAYPWITTIYLSFNAWNLTMGPRTPHLIGIANYQSIFSDGLFYQSLENTLILLLGLVAVQIPLALGIALLLDREMRAKRIVITAVLIPALIAPAVAGLLWKLFVQEQFGLFNWFLSFLKFAPVSWLSQFPIVILLVMVVNMWLELPFDAIVLLAGLKSIPHDRFDSARVDGASRVQIFRYIKVPALMPFIVIVLIFETFFVLRTFDVVITLVGATGGSGSVASVLGTYLYFTSFKVFDLGLGSAISVIMFLIAFLITGSLLFSMRKELIF